MKMVKKILIGAVAVAMLALVGCKQDFGEGKASGVKYNKTLTVDATAENTKNPCETKYRRVFSQLNNNLVKVGKLEMDISVKPENLGKSSVGLAFDVTKKEASGLPEAGQKFKIGETVITDSKGNDIVIENGDELLDFVLIGYKSEYSLDNGATTLEDGFYIEHYVDVPKKYLDDTMDTNVGSTGNYYAILKGATLKCTDTTNANKSNDYFNVDGAVTKDEEGVKTFKLTIDQDFQTVKPADNYMGTYTIKIGGTKVGTYKSNMNIISKKGDNTRTKTTEYGEAGDVYMYANCYESCKVVVNYNTTNKEYKYNSATNMWALTADDED